MRSNVLHLATCRDGVLVARKDLDTGCRIVPGAMVWFHGHLAPVWMPLSGIVSV
ncbi:hypothetical protein [Nocardia wallacei]|uniref:hypothetical protein n=1 Tax=Nocardia wallacei TaxID=480035 RepID=UPI002455CCB8|nr:hypothetical protein [Nocardia wallacei]